ncbi:MAG: S9 family peptidase [Anaerolineae bacterium]|nr:S9 family peptidase [Anaerolineae bacterium]
MTNNTMYTIAQYLNVRRAYSPSFSSDGRKLAFLMDVTGVPQVWQVAVPPVLSEVLWPDQLTFGNERVSQPVFSPAPGDTRLIYSCDIGGSEKMQLFLLSLDEGTVVNLTAGYEDAMHIFGEWSANGSHILFAANRRDPRIFDLYCQPVSSSVPGEAVLVWQNDRPGYLYNQSFSPDGQHAVVTRMASSFNHDLLEIDLKTGAARALLATAAWVRFPSIQYAPDGSSLFINTDLESDFLYIARLDLETGLLETLSAPASWDCEGMKLSPDGRLLAYTINVEGAHQLQIYDVATATVRTAPGLGEVPGMVMGDIAFSSVDRRVAFAFTSATRTTDVYVWDLVCDQVLPVTRASHAGIPTTTFVAPALVRYPTFDTDESGAPRQIPAWFYRPVPIVADPPTALPLPVIVMVHGGPEGQFRAYFHALIQYFVRHGYAVLAPNVRGSTGYGKTYSHLDDVEKRMDSVADLAHAVYWLRNQPGVDGERIVVFGGSYGGFMVLAALTAYPDLWAAGVDVVGISNLVTFLENTSDYRRAHREAEYGSLARDREFLESIAPINHVDNICVPLMVIHGANDPRVPLSEAEQLVAVLKQRDVPVEFLVFDDEGHGIVKLKNKLVAYPAIIAFLEKYVMGE